VNKAVVITSINFPIIASPVIPAQAGIHKPSQVKSHCVMGSRLRGNDRCI
jgi:hypothetical protein